MIRINNHITFRLCENYILVRVNGQNILKKSIRETIEEGKQDGGKGSEE